MKQRDNHIDKTKTIGTLKFQWFDDGADDENRTRNASLGSWSFTTKLRPQINAYKCITAKQVCKDSSGTFFYDFNEKTS